MQQNWKKNSKASNIEIWHLAALSSFLEGIFTTFTSNVAQVVLTTDADLSLREGLILPQDRLGE